jgi:hypothetical protein
MGFVQRAFTPPGTGGREAQAIQAQTDAAAAIQAAQAKTQVVPTMPTPPEAAKPPSAAPQFMSGGSPGAKATAKATGTILGQVAAAGNISKQKATLG